MVWFSNPATKEINARAWLEHRGVEAWYPSEIRHRRIPKGKRKFAEYEARLVPRYIFARFTGRPQWDVLQGCKWLSRVIGVNGAPLPVTDEIMGQMSQVPERLEIIRRREAEKRVIRRGIGLRSLMVLCGAGLSMSQMSTLGLHESSQICSASGKSKSVLTGSERWQGLIRLTECAIFPMGRDTGSGLRHCHMVIARGTRRHAHVLACLCASLDDSEAMPGRDVGLFDSGLLPTALRVTSIPPALRRSKTVDMSADVFGMVDLARHGPDCRNRNRVQQDAAEMRRGGWPHATARLFVSSKSSDAYGAHCSVDQR